MPKKKKVVNEEINPAPQEQESLVNKVDTKEEIMEDKVAPVAKRFTRKSPKSKTQSAIVPKENSNNEIKIEKDNQNKVIQPGNDVVIREEIKKEIISEPKNLHLDIKSEKPKLEFPDEAGEIKIETISSEKSNKQKKYTNKKKPISKSKLDNNTVVPTHNQTEMNQISTEDKSEVQPKSNVRTEDLTTSIKEEPKKTSEGTYSDIPDIGIKVQPSDKKVIGNRFSKWDKKNKYNKERVDTKKEVEPQILVKQENTEINESLVKKTDIDKIKIPEILEETVKEKEVKVEQIDAKQEEIKPNKKKKKNKKVTVDNSANSENSVETKPQTKPQQVEKKPEPAKVIRKPEPEIIITINPKKMLTKEQEKNPFLIKFFTQLEDFLRKEVQVEKGQKLLVAMSGGVDSSVLFDALSILSFKMKFIIYVLHFNHKLRGLSSERDEKLVNQLSKDYNVQYFNASGDVKRFAERNSLSIEYAARQLRYNFFEKVARTLNANFVATAHTADDNAETFFLNLFRGSGLTGLSGIPAKRNLVKNVMMLRPLITFSKKELLEYAKIRRLKWFEDETNSLLNYTRNKIRLSLIPRLEEEFNPSITDIINQTTRLMSGADRLIREIVKKNYPLVVEDASQEKFTIKMPMLMANEDFIQGEIIQYLWLKYFRLQPLPMQTINRILSLNHSQSGAICEINSMYFVLKDRNNIIFTKRQYEENIKLLVSIPGKYFIGRYKIEFTLVDRSEVVFDDNPNIEFFDSSIMESFLEIRNWQTGDTFQPLGMKGDMKVSDFLINEKVPITEKASIIVLTNKSDIIWIVGKRISDKFKIKKNAKKVIKAVIIKNEKK